MIQFLKRNLFQKVSSASLPVLAFLLIFFNPFVCAAKKITITTNPQTAQIYINGVQRSVGKAVIFLSKKECLVIEIRSEGFITEIKNLCNKKGDYTSKSMYVQLQEDESFTSSAATTLVNKDNAVYAKPTKTKEEAWKQIVSAVINKFDGLETNDEKYGYLLTSWNGVSFKTNTVRCRLIIKMRKEDPLVYNMKIVSEESGKAGTSYLADEQYRQWNRLLRRYNDFLEELTILIAN